MKLTKSQLNNFQDTVWKFYAHEGRDLPWRKTHDPYKIMVSEMMLQQTQVNRVVVKYQLFIEQFPDFESLAKAPLATVLKTWSGLGYNRRAKFLHEASKIIVNEFGGQVPQTIDELKTLPGIGVNTAGAILAYSFNKPAFFIETNIRTVYIHHFFADATEVSDKEIEPIITQTIDQENSRQWYWALMDYGSYLKTTVGNMSKFSKHYTKQSRFEGSLRQLRGQVLRFLAQHSRNEQELFDEIGDERLKAVLESLCQEKLITKSGSTYHLG